MICPDSNRRVVVTGIGVVSPIGQTVEGFWNTLAGRGPLDQPGLSDETHPRRGPAGTADFGGTIDEFGELPAPVRKTLRKALRLMNRETQLGVAAGQKALADSGLQPHHDPQRIGVCFGAQNVSIMPQDFLSAIQACLAEDDDFDFTRWGSEGLPKVEPLWLLKCLPNMPACYLAIVNDLRGHSNTIAQRDVAANIAVAEACNVIKEGDVEAVLVGASGTTLHPYNLVHAQLEEEIQGNGPELPAVCRPFDRRRVGPPPGEGAGALILEDLDAALRRGARIYGEVRGAATSCVAGRDNTSACQTALANAMQLALQRGRSSRLAIGHLHAHGLGTRESDLAEGCAVAQVFGDRSTRQPPVVAAKSYWGNVGTGSGALELIASLLALQHGHLFPVRNCEQPDPACKVAPVADCRQEAGASFLNLSLVGRGLASCVAVSKYEE